MPTRSSLCALLGLVLVGSSFIATPGGGLWALAFWPGVVCLTAAGVLWLRNRPTPRRLAIGFGLVGFLLGAFVSILLVFSVMASSHTPVEMAGGAAFIAAVFSLGVAPIGGIVFGGIGVWLGITLGKRTRGDPCPIPPPESAAEPDAPADRPRDTRFFER